jgi:ATP adenylyltransferase
MPIPVLRRHGIVERVGNEVHLNALLTPEEREEIVKLCDAKIEAYKAQRGAAIWQHRTVGLGALPGSIRYEVLKRAKFRCDLCGVPASERALEVDHIKPRKHGGTDEPENLQALCWKCNSGKGASDDTDFRQFRRAAEAEASR